MPGSRDKHHKKDSSDESDSSSTSPSSSELECFSNDKECNKHHKKHYKHHKHDKSNKSEKSDSECSDKSKSDCKPKFKLCDIYNYFKNRLLEDEQLMIAGSTAYTNSTNTISEQIPTNHSLKLNNDVIMYNIDRFNEDSPFFVRESGVYVFFVCINTDNSAQFTFFVNGIAIPTTCIGTNSGAGQLVSRHMLQLNKNDGVVIRNYTSNVPSVYVNIGMGGLQLGNSVVAVGFKIAPLNPAQVCEENECKFMETLTHKKKKLFKKLTEKVICDKTLMPKGFNVHGTFYNKSTQIVNTEADVVFNSTSVVEGLYWDPVAPTEIRVEECGVYKVFFLVTTNTAGQFSIAVNGIPVVYTTQGTNRGAGQLTIRAILELKQGDIVTVKNHTSANGSIVISEYAGGTYQAISSILTVLKLAPIEKAQCVPVDCKLAKHYECYYPLFREYLLYHHFLQIAGVKSYVSLSTSVHQNLVIGDSVHWAIKLLNQNTWFTQGNNYLTIEKDGIYDIFADIITDEPEQITMFVNGVPDYTTTFGRDSGASRCLMRQFVPLKRGDQISIRNWESHAGTVSTAENPGGNFPGQNSMLMAFMLSPMCVPPGPPGPPGPPLAPPTGKQVSDAKSKSIKTK